jgi:succinyl-CoA synthetase alpha subunit
MKEIVVQGVYSRFDQYHVQQSMLVGTKFIGSWGCLVSGLPLLEKMPSCDASWILTPTLEAILAALQAGVKLIVCDMRHIPLHDKQQIYKAQKECLIIEGYMKPYECRLGTMPPGLYKRGDIGIIAASKSLGLEAAFESDGQFLVVHRGESSVEQVLPLFEQRTVRII